MRWGWASLEWIGPFHWAFPLGMSVFLAWMSIALKDKETRTRCIILVTTGILGLSAYFGGPMVMMWAYSRWLWLCPPWQAFAYAVSPVGLYAILGAIYFLIVHRLLSPSRATMWTGILVFALAFPIAESILWATRHIGGSSAINAIKSGYVFPIVAFSLGLPLIRDIRQAPALKTPTLQKPEGKMKLHSHIRLLIFVTIAWILFWIAGLPDYYQQYTLKFMIILDLAILPPIWLIIYHSVKKSRLGGALNASLWWAFYISCPLFIYDFIYVGIYLGKGISFLSSYWYLTVYYILPWFLFPLTGCMVEKRRSKTTAFRATRFPRA